MIIKITPEERDLIVGALNDKAWELTGEAQTMGRYNADLAMTYRQASVQRSQLAHRLQDAT